MGKTDVEYATDQITIRKDCPFDCDYCWRKLPINQNRLNRFPPRPIETALKYANARKRRVIMVSFFSEPYTLGEKYERITKKVLQILVPTKHTIMILTKNPILAERDYRLLKDNCWMGSTITAPYKIPDEPYASHNPERIKALKLAKSLGIKTWISLEPILPHVINDIPLLIKNTHTFIDYYVIGRLDYETQLGYSKIPKRFYLPVLRKVIQLLHKLGYRRGRFQQKKDFVRQTIIYPEPKTYHIKRQLALNP